MVIPETNLADFVWQDVTGHADLPALVSSSCICTSFVVIVAVNDRKKIFGVLIFKELDVLSGELEAAPEA